MVQGTPKSKIGSMEKLYFIADPENGYEMLPEERTGLVCHECGMALDENYVNPDIKVRKTCPDLSHTYDGYRIASQRFLETVQAAGYHGLQFDPLPKSPTFYRMKVLNPLKLTRPPQVKFEEFCHACSRFVSVYGLDHVKVILPPGAVVDGIYRSDFKLGHGGMMFYWFIVNETVTKNLKAAKLRGLSFFSVSVENEKGQSD